jgi:hypothetical protein
MAAEHAEVEHIIISLILQNFNYFAKPILSNGDVRVSGIVTGETAFVLLQPKPSHADSEHWRLAIGSSGKSADTDTVAPGQGSGHVSTCRVVAECDGHTAGAGVTGQFPAATLHG